MKKYFPRIVDDVLSFKLRSKGAVWIRGPKWCGKSTTAERFAKTCIYMQDEDTREQNVALARLSPSKFLQGETPFLIDEWQVIPFIWNQIRREVDKRDEFGQFILTGSRLPKEEDEIEKGQHSGTGRITNLLMRPMSLYESGESNGQISLKQLFEGNNTEPCRCETTLDDYAFLTARGGWPKAVGCAQDVALQQAIDYYEGIVNSDISEADDISKKPDRVKLLMRSYARNCSTQANNSTIKADMLSNDSKKLDEDTIHSYIRALKRLFVIEESEAWNPNHRSKTAIRTMNTRYFVDPSIGCAALGLGPDGLIRDIKTFGFMFENLCIRDLRVYADSIGGEVKHFRNSAGLEVDAVIVLRDGSWAGIEIKLGSQSLIDDGARNLLKLADDIGDGLPKPSFLMVLTATQNAYLRDDGVWVVPLGCLRD